MKYCIITYGCQMNKNDSERIATFLEKNGLQKANEELADIIFINACSVRQSAVDRIMGKIKEIKLNKKKPLTVLLGCVLPKDKKIFEQHFDYIFPTQELSRWTLPFLDKNLVPKNYFSLPPKRESSSAFITIMTGCNNFCSYCVVPFTKGREISRPAEEIIEEAKNAISAGHKEIWLLGQNVNSYRGEIDFPDLLGKIDRLKGDFWIRFISSHPKDFSDKLIDAIKNYKKVTNYLNLPLQSGDDTVLDKMNRPYSANQYEELVEKIRAAIPDITLSTDIIVGFPGEEEKHFRNTAKLFSKIGFDMAYIARYSPRFDTAAIEMEETASEEEKKRREKILTELLKESSLERNQCFKGEEVRVLVLGKNKKGNLLGRTYGHKHVLFDGSSKLINNFVKVKITQSALWGLRGEIIPK